MSTITKRVTSTGEIRYRALLQIRREEVNYTESRTFSKKSLAEAWLKKREVELEANPGNSKLVFRLFTNAFGT